MRIDLLAVRLLIGCGLLVPACALGITAKRQEPRAPVSDLAALERSAFDAVNDVREEAGLPRLAITAQLVRLARAHSQHQARTGKAGHSGAKGSSPADRAREAGIDYRAFAENVAMNQGYADPVKVALDGWMKSSGHRKNILNPIFKETGIGVAVGPDGAVYFTQVFLDPLQPRS